MPSRSHCTCTPGVAVADGVRSFVRSMRKMPAVAEKLLKTGSTEGLFARLPGSKSGLGKPANA